MTLSPIIVTRDDKEFTVTYRQKTNNSPQYIYQGPLQFEYAKLIRVHTPHNHTTHYGLTIINKYNAFKTQPVIWLTTQTETEEA